MEGNEEVFVQHPHGNYIRINTPRVSNRFLKEFIHTQTDFSRIEVINVVDDASSTFYGHIIDHPMLEEFMTKEVDDILEMINERDNPEVAQKFFRIMVSRVLAKLEHSATMDDFEEFLDHRQNRKSARTQAGVHAAE